MSFAHGCDRSLGFLMGYYVITIFNLPWSTSADFSEFRIVKGLFLFNAADTTFVI